MTCPRLVRADRPNSLNEVSHIFPLPPLLLLLLRSEFSTRTGKGSVKSFPEWGTFVSFRNPRGIFNLLPPDCRKTEMQNWNGSEKRIEILTRRQKLLFCFIFHAREFPLRERELCTSTSWNSQISRHEKCTEKRARAPETSVSVNFLRQCCTVRRERIQITVVLLPWNCWITATGYCVKSP